LEGKTATAIQFIHASAEVRQLYWLDYSGKRQLFLTLQPWQTYVQVKSRSVPQPRRVARLSC
jgi:hypothetical protein